MTNTNRDLFIHAQLVRDDSEMSYRPTVASWQTKPRELWLDKNRKVDVEIEAVDVEDTKVRTITNGDVKVVKVERSFVGCHGKFCRVIHHTHFNHLEIRVHVKDA